MPRVHGIDLPRHRRRPAVLSRSSSTFSNSHCARNFGSGVVGIHFTSFRSNSEGTAKAVANNCAYNGVADAKSITPGKIEPLPKKDLDRLKFGSKSFSVATVSISSAGNDTHTTIATRNSSTMHIANSGSLGNSSTATNFPLSDPEDTSNKENQHTTILDRVDQDQMNSSASVENAAEERVDEGGSPKQKDTDFEYKYEDDSSVTTMRDDGSIDLLEDDDCNQNGKRTEFCSGNKPKNTSQDTSNEEFVQSPNPTPTKCIGKPRSKFTPSPISPATQTLNRLANVGIQVENLTQLDAQLKKDDGGDGSDKSFHLLALAATNKWEEQHCKHEDNGKKQYEKQAKSIGLKNHGKADESEYESEECSKEDDRSAISSENQSEKTPRPVRKIPYDCSNVEAKSKNDQIKSKKEQIINRLKSYFMTTKNSSEYAKKASVEAPLVQFCHRCTNTMAKYLPHHALCPKHPDFFNSGSYEILCILVDGFDHKCEACMFQFDNGRPNKELSHAPTCNRSDNKKCSGVNESESQQTKSSLSSKRIHVDVPLAVSAQSGCRKCKQELETGEKNSLIHDIKCPRRRNTKNLPPLSVSASSGCKKCIREMRTGCASSRGHDKCCPRRRKVIPRNEEDEGDESISKIENITPRKRKERPPLAAFAIPALSPVSLVDAAKVCKKCRTELNGGMKTANAHDPSCPRKRANRASRELQALQHPKDDMLARELGTYQKLDQRESSDGVVDFVPSRNLGSASKEEPPGFDNEILSLKNNDRDSDELPLSEYERLRLKNIQRNESRLAQLGLLVPSSKKQNEKSRSTLSDLLESGKPQNRGRSGEKKAAPKSTRKRCLPNRRTKCDQSEKQNISGYDSSSSAKRDDCYGSSPRTGYTCDPSSSTSTNSNNCSGSSPRISNTSDSNSSKIEYEKPTSTTQNTNGKVLEEDGCVGRRLNQIEAKPHKEVGWQSRQKKEVESNIFVSSRNSIKQSKKRRDASEVFLAAKSGCKKYRVEWQTERQDLPSTNDLHCLRHRKVSAKHDDDRTPPPHLPLVQTASLLNQFQSAIRSITPSPTHQSSNPPDFPSFVASFISRPSDTCDTEIPAPRGAKWLPCPNPWGEVGHNEGDFVVISPFRSESANVMLSAFHQGPNFEPPRRFLANPLEMDSCYLSTHRSPARGGYSVLSLKRDRMGMKPWGFTVRRHEFGGACLVQSVEPLSPAVGAEDISGWQNEDSSLKINDMVLCINGKTVGGMTEFEFQIEMDLCGPSMTLVVSRFDILESAFATDQRNNGLRDLAMDWTDVGAGILFSNKYGCSKANFVNPAPYLAEQSKNYEFEGSLTAEQTSPSMQPKANEFFDQEDNKTQSTDHYHTHHHFSNINPIILSRTKKESTTSTSTNEGDHNNLHSPPTKDSIQRENHNFEPVIKNTCEPDHIGDCNGHEGGLSKLYSALSNDDASKEVCHDRTRVSASGSKNTATKQYGSKTPKRRNIENSYRKPSNPAQARGPFPPKAVKRAGRMLDEHSDSSAIEVEGPPTGANNTKPICEASEACSFRKENRQGNQFNPKLSNKQSNDDSSHFRIDNKEFAEEESDENPWLGCVCGSTHPHPIRVFWIQCESCESWYNVAEECVGFDEKKAEILDEWFCWACKPPVAGLGL